MTSLEGKHLVQMFSLWTYFQRLRGSTAVIYGHLWLSNGQSFILLLDKMNILRLHSIKTHTNQLTDTVCLYESQENKQNFT